MLHRVQDDLVAKQAQRHRPGDVEIEWTEEPRRQRHLALAIDPDERVGDVGEYLTEIDMIELGRIVDTGLDCPECVHPIGNLVEVAASGLVERAAMNMKHVADRLQIVLHAVVEFANQDLLLGERAGQTHFAIGKRSPGFRHFDGDLERSAQPRQLTGRFDDIIVEAGFHQVDRDLLGAGAGEHDDGTRGISRLDGRQNVAAV